MKFQTRIVACAGLLLTTGCAVRHYRPAPVSTASSLALFEIKSLDDPAFRQYLQFHSPAPPKSDSDADWSLDNLIVAGYYFSPELDFARSNVAIAEAATVTAGMRPNPTLGLSGGYSTSPDSPYLWNVDISIPIETAHKRGYRMLQANELHEASRIALAEAAWQIRAKVRTALLEHIIAARDVRALNAEVEGRTVLLHLSERRLELGEATRSEVNNAAVDLSNATLALHVGESLVETTRSTLASVIGIPLKDLMTRRLVWKELDNPARFETAQIEHEAALNRLDLQQALAEYRASDADLHLQLAKQYPDLQLSPHTDRQEGFNNYSLGVVLELPLLNRNQGPIAEAEAKRKAAAAHLSTLQNIAIGEVNTAVAEYRSAQKRRTEAQGRLQRLQSQLRAQAEQAVQQGEEDRSFSVLVRVQEAIATRAVVDAVRSEQSAVGALENAMQKPFDFNSPTYQLDILPAGANQHRSARR